ncbi:hypothetical protein Q0M94_28305 (plasmid) [Deinococcus radiomollis]|uniref:hypothetical protein n=1 Tax=Deinococcus radiomollis TaxID=468916 RepID=UPI003892BFF3
MADEPQMTRSEWERERATELNSKTVADLAGKVAALEFDLKAKRTELDTVKAQLPAEGSQVLSKADAERWAKYNALGKPEELETARQAGTEAAQKLSQYERRDSIRTAAEVAGFKPSVLERLAPDGGTFEVREAQVDGKPVRTAFLKLPDGNEKPLREWAASEHADFMPSLQAQAQAPVPPAAAWVPQPAAPATQPGAQASPWARFTAQRDEMNNAPIAK